MQQPTVFTNSFLLGLRDRMVITGSSPNLRSIRIDAYRLWAEPDRRDQ
jgi:hypothetical protein